MAARVWPAPATLLKRRSVESPLPPRVSPEAHDAGLPLKRFGDLTPSPCRRLRGILISMMELSVTFRIVMGASSVVIMFAAYGVYFWQSTRQNNVQPHPFSWLLWGLVTGVAYVVQVVMGAGPGSWVAGFTAVICLLIGTFSLLRNRWHFSRFEWISLGAGLVVLLYYLIVKNPTWSAILATATDVIGYAPTLRKGWLEPRRDSVTSFALNSAKFIPALAALNSYSLATWLYPATLVVVNGLVACLLLYRRRVVE